MATCSLLRHSFTRRQFGQHDYPASHASSHLPIVTLGIWPHREWLLSLLRGLKRFGLFEVSPTRRHPSRATCTSAVRFQECRALQPSLAYSGIQDVLWQCHGSSRCRQTDVEIVAISKCRSLRPWSSDIQSFKAVHRISWSLVLCLVHGCLIFACTAIFC